MTEQALGHDPFGDDTDDLAELGDVLAPVDKTSLDPEGMKAVQRAGGFDRSVFRGEPKEAPPEAPVAEETPREPLKSIQFRLPESEIDAFHAAAYEEFGNTHGAKTNLFRLMRSLYEEKKAAS